jgi:hypothetical protein
MRKFALVALLGLVAAHQAAAFVPAMPATNRAASASRTGTYFSYIYAVDGRGNSVVGVSVCVCVCF